VIDALKNIIPAEIIVLFISAMPILELRGGILAAFLLGMPWLEAFIICVIGTILPTPFIILFIKKIFEWMEKKSKRLAKLVSRLEKKAHKGGKKLERFKIVGLTIFAAIPLPGFGAWTAALIAAFLNMKLKEAMPPIIIGSALAGLIMVLIGYGIIGNISP
jgi:uncharacterized membrane protein